MAKTPNSNFVTRKHLARLQRERIQQRYLLIGSIGVIVVVVGLILFGILDQTVLQSSRPVARVGNEVVSTGEFQTQVRYTRYRLIEQLNYFASDPAMIQFFGSYVQQIQSQLEATDQLGQQVLDRIIEDKIIAHVAAKMGITVSEEELDKAVEQFFGYFPNGTLTPTVTPTTFSTATLSATQLALVPPTATPTETLPPTETVAPTESLATATPPDVTATPTTEMTATPDYTPTPEPSPTVYTREGYQGVYDLYVETLDGIDFSREELRELLKAQLLRDQMIAEITKDTKPEAEQVWARHILVATEEEAKAVRARLAAGEDFAALAKELSTDTSNKDNGGDLQWFSKEAMVAPFSEAAFSMQVGDISDPVQSTFGYHIIQVLGHEVRPLTAEAFKQATDTVFSQWIDTQKTELKVETFDRWMQVVPTTPSIPPELLQAISTSPDSGTGTTLP